jgi:NitT/TauT family transport system substrate-binding protein
LIRRGPFLTAAGAALVAAPRAVRAQGLTPVRVACVPNDDVTPLLYAQQSGLFRRAGLDVTATAATSGAAIAAAVAGAAYDIGLISMMGTITGHARGVPFVMIAPSLIYVSTDPSQQLLVLKESPIKGARDMPGKIVSCSAIRDVNWVSIRAWADLQGVDSSAIKFVEMPMSSVPAALQQKRIDVGSLLDPTLGDAMATGNFRSVGAPFDGVAKRWLGAAWSTTLDFVKKNRDTVDRFASVMRTATLYVNAHHAETAPLFAAFAGLEPGRVLAMKPVELGDYLDPRDIQPAIDVAAKYGIIEKSFPAQEMISPYAPKPPHTS